MNEYFLIDSDSLNVKSELYGYSYSDKGLMIKKPLSGSLEGSFVSILQNDNLISIEQDYLGSWGIYIYQTNGKEGEEGYNNTSNRFVISNSFIALYQYLSLNKLTFTINQKFCDSLIAADLCSHSVIDTPISEIKELDRHSQVIIHKNTKTMEIVTSQKTDFTVDLNSQEGFDILDKWHFRWINRIKDTVSQTNNIQIDLSGGFDSRMVLALFLSSGIDMNKIFVNSLNDGKHVHGEDYKIASEIAEHFGFRLNNAEHIDPDNTPFTLDQMLHISFGIKSCFHKQMYYNYSKRKKTLYRFTGEGGEGPRMYGGELVNIDKILKRAEKIGMDEKSKNNLQEQYKADIKNIERMYPDCKNPDMLDTRLYMETRVRNHYGKSFAERYFANIITIAPMLDPELLKIKAGIKLLPAVIFARYCPDLLYFDVEGNRNFTNEEIAYANELCSKYPKKRFTKPKQRFVLSKIETPFISDNKQPYVKNKDVTEWMLNIFQSNELICSYQPNIYQHALDVLRTKNYHPLSEVQTLLSLFMVEEAINGKEPRLKFIDISPTTKRLLRSHNALKPYVTARIDVKSMNDSKVQITMISDSDCKITSPSFIGNGYMITSEAGDISFRIEKQGDGPVRIFLRSIFASDKDGNHIHFWLDYDCMSLNGQNVLENTRTVCHDKPFIKDEVPNSRSMGMTL